MSKGVKTQVEESLMAKDPTSWSSIVLELRWIKIHQLCFNAWVHKDICPIKAFEVRKLGESWVKQIFFPVGLLRAIKMCCKSLKEEIHWMLSSLRLTFGFYTLTSVKLDCIFQSMAWHNLINSVFSFLVVHKNNGASYNQKFLRFCKIQ